MIKQYVLRLENTQQQMFRYHWGYQLHGMLLALLIANGSSGEIDNRDPALISQRVVPALGGRADWTVNLLGQPALRLFEDELDALNKFKLEHQGLTVVVKERTTRELLSVKELMEWSGEALEGDRFTITFETPTSFKSDNEYALFPSIRWLVKSLISKWNDVWPHTFIGDDDAIDALIHGLRITSYKLQSSYYHMKGTRVPGFIGEIQVASRLSVPMLELWKTLLSFGNYSGVGIKCALGMGGIRASITPFKKSV